MKCLNDWYFKRCLFVWCSVQMRRLINISHLCSHNEVGKKLDWNEKSENRKRDKLTLINGIVVSTRLIFLWIFIREATTNELNNDLQLKALHWRLKLPSRVFSKSFKEKSLIWWLQFVNIEMISIRSWNKVNSNFPQIANEWIFFSVANAFSEGDSSRIFYSMKVALTWFLELSL